MSTRKPEAPPKKQGTSLRTSDARPPATHAAEDEFDVAAVVDEANSRIREIGARHEGLCVFLTRAMFGSDGHAALSKEGLLNQRYVRLRDRAGKSLDMSAEELRDHTRIGAIFLLRPRDDGWRGIAWSEKLELLPLLALDDDRDAFNRGVLLAARPNVGRAHVRAFVKEETKGLPGRADPALPAKVTIAKGSKFAETGVVLLGNARQRAELAKQIDAAPPPRRREVVRDLKKTLENLGALLKLLDEPGDE